MDVRCERCNAQYAVDDGLVQEAGLAVRCAMCGHSFRVMRSPGWSLRKTTGDVYPLPDAATLQRWVVEGRVTREDEVAEPGHSWVKAGSLADLEPFFALVDQARRTRSTPRQSEPSGPPAQREARSETGELVLGNAASTAADAWQAPAPDSVQANEPAWAAGPLGMAPDAGVRKKAVPSTRARREPEPRRRSWPVLVLVFVLLAVLGGATGVSLYLFKDDVVSLDFAKLVQDWSQWIGGVDKATGGGAARTLAPVTGGTRPEPEPTRAPAPPAAPPVNASPPEARVPGSGTPGAAAAPPSGTLTPAETPPGATTEPPPASPAPPAAAAPPGNGAPAASGEPAPPPRAAEPNGPTAPSAEAPPPAPTPAAPVAESRRPAPPVAGVAPPAPKATVIAEKGVAERKPDPVARSRALVDQARSLRDRGRASAALDVYARALQLDARSADALAGRGLAYLDLSQYREAEESFKGALDINGSHPAALMGLAETFRYEGKRSDAVTYYRRYLAAQPRGEDATAARKAIQALEESP